MLYLTEAEVAELLTPADALDAVEGSFRRLAAGEVENVPRQRTRFEDGALAVMWAVDRELGLAGVKTYAAGASNATFVVVLFETETQTAVAVIEADKLGQLRTGAASGVAARYLARPGATSLGVIGCGWQARSQVAAIREALPGIETVVAYCRSDERLDEFCAEVGAEAGESHRDAAGQDVVVTVTTSKDPVLRGEWLKPGALVCAVGANDPRRRELDNVVLERAAFVCCDSVANARRESGDLIEPVEAGVLDWLEVHELQEVVAGELPGRQADDDLVVFKSNGLAAWDVAIGAVAVEHARTIVKAIIDEAHKNNLKVAVHATERITAQLAVEAGCDYLVHGIHDEIVGDVFIKMLKQKQIILCPTSNVEYPILRAFTQNLYYTNFELSHANPFVIKTFFDLQELDTALYQSTKHKWETNKKIFKRDSIRLINLKKLADAGVRIATGTDVGSLGSMPATSYLPEVLKMKQSGMSNWEIIKAATFNPTYFINKEGSLGTITDGKVADMILLNKNPVSDLENLTSIALVFKDGYAISPDTLITETPDMIVQRQWNAYNAKNIQAFLACYDTHIKVYNFPNSLLFEGIETFGKKQVSMFEKNLNAHCQIKNRIISGNTVVDKVIMKEDFKVTSELTIIYQINKSKITNVYFVR